ncbi:MAG: thioredoxin domain-containing protein [Candidatus Saccharibacteria bacterium]|nr:thioredoxin domain-containing protein [Candidatus Saccharibacteria bacterium]
MQEDKKWLFFRIGLVIAFISLIFYGIYINNLNKLDLSKYNKDQIITSTADNGGFGDLVLGNPNAKVVIIEYGDYQCPACGSYREKFEKLVTTYPDKVALVFRQYIIPGHTDARAASATALAAARQGKFWQMHNKLFSSLAEWNGKSNQRAKIFENYARDLGLDIDKYHQDLESEDITKKISFDMTLGKAHQLEATPTIVVNGEKVDYEIWSKDDKFANFLTEKLK